MKKLNLHSETLRTLSATQAGDIFGGQPRQEMVLTVLDPVVCTVLTAMGGCPDTQRLDECIAL